ncbi:MAG: hypothetical protein ACH36H_06870 [Candidatus Nanopelagicales bacterium]
MIAMIGPLFGASAALVVIAFFDHPYADNPGGIGSDAMQFTLDDLTQTPLTGMPTPSCPTSA